MLRRALATLSNGALMVLVVSAVPPCYLVCKQSASNDSMKKLSLNFFGHIGSEI